MAPSVKICGLRTPADVDACVAAGVDYVGFNFAPESARRVDAEVARALIARLPSDGPIPVGVFRNQTANAVMRNARAAGVHVVQLHGAEPPPFCSAIGEFDIWKALVGDEVSEAELRAYASVCDGLLVDGRSPGSGAAWDYARVAPWLEGGEFDGLPVWVAGGLTPSNAKAESGSR